MPDDIQPASLEVLEPDYHVAAFFVPARQRQAVLALMVFQVELARVATQVSEPMVAQIRYAWWRDQVDAVFAGRPVFAPAVQGLGDAVKSHKLPRTLIDGMIDAHSRDCDTVPFATMAVLDAYSEGTVGNLLKLMCLVLGADARADAACALAGRACGTARQLQEFAHWRRHRRLRLPLDAVLSVGLSEEDVFSDDAARLRLHPVFSELKVRLRGQLGLLNGTRFPRAAMPALALAALARPMVAPAFDPYQPSATSPAMRVVRLAGANLLWRF